MTNPSTEYSIITVSDAAGEIDYIKSTKEYIEELAAQSNGAFSYMVVQQIKQEDGSYKLRQLAGLPADNDQLAALSAAGVDITLDDIVDDVEARLAQDENLKVTINAAGANTLNQAAAIQDAIALGTETLAHIKNTVHTPSAGDKDTFFSHDVEIVTPESEENIVEKFQMFSETERAIIAGRYTQIGAIPHGYTPENIEKAWSSFKTVAANDPASFPGQVIQALENGEKLYLAMMPAGFDKMDPADMAKHIPVTEAEVTPVFEAIGRHIEPGTKGVFIGGGPRDLAGLKVGQDAFRAAVNAYKSGQLQAGAEQEPVVLEEPFAFGRSYNTTQVFIAIAQKYPGQVVEMGIGGEANAMRDAVAQHLVGTGVKVGMVVSDVLVQRKDYLGRDKADGVPAITLVDNEVAYDFGNNNIFENFDDYTPAGEKRQDPAKAIVKTLYPR